MENNSVARVFIGGPREETEEEFEKRVSKEMYTLCVIRNKKELNLDQFRKEIKQSIGNEEASIHEILEWFDSLTLEEKQELIDKCSIEYDEGDILQELSDRLERNSNRLREFSDSLERNTMDKPILVPINPNSDKTTMIRAEMHGYRKPYTIPLNPRTEKECTKRDNFNKFVNSKMSRRKK